MFHADVSKAKSGAASKETVVDWGKQKVFNKEVYAKDLANGKYFCSLKESNKGFIEDESMEDYVEHSHKGDPKKDGDAESS